MEVTETLGLILMAPLAVVFLISVGVVIYDEKDWSGVLLVVLLLMFVAGLVLFLVGKF